MIVILSRRAETELEGIGDHIAESNPHRAFSFVHELRQSCAELAVMPERFPLVRRYERYRIRRRIHGNYLIFFQIDAGTIHVLHILHGAMRYETILDFKLR